MDFEAALAENERRKAKLKEISEAYDPLSGRASFSVPRKEVSIRGMPLGTLFLPEAMCREPLVEGLVRAGSVEEFIESLGKKPSARIVRGLVLAFNKLRIRYDFEFWAYTCVVIEDKETSLEIPFLLNRGQRKFLASLEEDRLAGRPIRIVLCKSRQWGGSTLTQVYMAWLQMVHRKRWHSVIVAQQENTARTIKGMYATLIRRYPRSLTGGKPLRFEPYMGSQKTSAIRSRGCRVTIGSAERPDALRGEHMCMAHISEFGIWKTTAGKSPDDLLQSVVGGIHIGPDTLIVVESTAKGVGNPFHRMWLDAESPSSSSPYKAVFIAWFDVDMNAAPVPDARAFWQSLSEDERELFLAHGEVTLEALRWRRLKLAELKGDLWRLKSEYPSTAQEAFESTGARVFPAAHVARMRLRCREPLFRAEVACRAGENRVGEAAAREPLLYRREDGRMKVWTPPPVAPTVSDRFVVAVDVGGRGEASDFSVITVLDRFYMADGGVPEVAARWRGHCDHDILAWKAVQTAMLYENALLAIESNTLETERTEGSHGEYIFDEIALFYAARLYARTSAQDIRDRIPPKWGYQTNRQTKPDLIDTLIAALREEGYIERDREACDEMDTYEIDDRGAYNAKEGCHDDIVMSTAIALKVCFDLRRLPLPAPMQKAVPPPSPPSPAASLGAADF